MDQKMSRRKFMTTVAVAGAAAGALGFPEVNKTGAAAPIKLKVQTIWEGGTLGYNAFQQFCKSVGRMSNGKLTVEGYPAGTIIETYEMFDAVKARVIDGMHCFDSYWAEKIPVATFFSSYPFGLDRPDQWETWFNALGGKKIAREAFAKHNMFYVGPIQQGENLIHAKVPIRSFDDFKDKKIKCPGGITADFFRAIGVTAVSLPGKDVHPTITDEGIDALYYGSAGIRDISGYGDIAGYLILDTPVASGLRKSVNIMSIAINQRTWKKIPKNLQLIFEAAVAKHSNDQYAAFQKADMEAFKKIMADEEAGDATDTKPLKEEKPESAVSKAVSPDNEPLGPSTEIIHLSESDMNRFKQFAPAMWIKWAKKSKLAMQAFKSQLAFMKSPILGYITDDDMVDLDGKKLVY